MIALTNRDRLTASARRLSRAADDFIVSTKIVYAEISNSMGRFHGRLKARCLPWAKVLTSEFIVAGNLAEFPEELVPFVSDHRLERVASGRSGDDVWRVRSPGGRPMVVKRATLDHAGQIDREICALRWLTAYGIPCPAVLASASNRYGHWLLMSEVSGRSLDAALDLGADKLVSIAARALSFLHERPVGSCPLDQRFDRQLEAAEQQLALGLVNAEDFDEERRGQRPEDLFRQLHALRNHEEDLVVSHGDATFENMLESGGHFSGFVDCGGLGVADRYRDLALAARSIQHFLGPEWVDVFFTQYGKEADQGKIDLYQLLDEFF